MCVNVVAIAVDVDDKQIFMGDVHGDIEAFAICLQLADLVNDNGDWAGGTTVLVQVKSIKNHIQWCYATASI
jgi:hypothetical protein